MKGKFFILAWRNIWRKKIRSFLTMLLIGLFLTIVIFFLQMQKWTWMNQIDTSLSGYVGYIQITDTAFVKEKSMDNMFSLDKINLEELRSIEGVRGVYPRIQSGVLASVGIRSKSAGVLGINPSDDNDLMKLEQKLSEGELLDNDDDQILITNQMAKFYKVKVGDSLILFGSGYQGYTAAGNYRIKGIVRIPAGDMSNMVYMSMKEAQHIFAANGMVTAVLVNIEEGADLYKITDEVKSKITDKSLIARNWEEVMPELKSGMELDTVSNQMMTGILLLIVCFGIFGTIVMTYSERLFEFGILLSIGMSKRMIMLVTVAEIYFLMLLGVFLGCLIVTPILYSIHNNPIQLTGNAAETMIEYGIDPIMSVGLYPSEYINSSMIIIIITFIMSLYVIFKIRKLTPLDAMKKH
ncbi:MAG: ABC transporter permease [Crocinitomicaceae bacterium]|nr:ABC transporter permease [Crocinitomicaceae bacterium]